MGYPKFKDKHLQSSLINPSHFVRYKDLPTNLPKKYIIIYQKSAFRYIKRKYNFKKIKIKNINDFYVCKDIGLLKMPGIGSPQATVVMEEFIALGGKEFLNIGTAGGLHKEGIFLCKKALRDEGTSYHYLPHGKFIEPHEELTKKFGKFIKKQGLEYFDGTTWTIDAPYRETRAEVEKYSKKGVSTVEMEASALFALAKFRKVKIASAFVVSDVLGKKWEPKFHHIDVTKNLNKLVDAAMECLK